MKYISILMIILGTASAFAEDANCIFDLQRCQSGRGNYDMSCRYAYEDCINADNPMYQAVKKEQERELQCEMDNRQKGTDTACWSQYIHAPAVQKEMKSHMQTLNMTPSEQQNMMEFWVRQFEKMDSKSNSTSNSLGSSVTLSPFNGHLQDNQTYTEGKIYKWKDNKGVIHVTNDFGKVPTEYKNQVQ